MIRKCVLAFAMAAVAAVPLYAAGTATVTTSDLGAGITQYSIAWVSDASGAVSGNTIAIKRGVILGVKFKPDGRGTQPTDLYDMTFEDADNVDLLLGGGANLSNANATRKKPALNTSDELFFEGCTTCELVVSNAGNAKGGTVILLVGR